MTSKQVQWWENRLRFSLAGKEFCLFVHNVNCGWPPYRMTERSVELALADDWLQQHNPDPDIFEIGAVTPYYWPGRIRNIVDPADQHRLVNYRCSLFDCNFRGKKVLSISTLEHVGTGEYNLNEKGDSCAGEAVKKILSEAQAFLITIPIGYNESLDRYIFQKQSGFSQTEVLFIKRGEGKRNNSWHQVSAAAAMGTKYTKSANGLIVLRR